MRITSGTLDLGQASTVDSLTMTGGVLQGAGDVTVKDDLRWSTSTIRGTGRLKLRDMSPRTYIAVVETAPEMSVGVESVDKEASFHVVRGSW